MQGCLRAECSNPSIERTFQRPLRALGPPLMSNLRRHSMPTHTLPCSWPLRLDAQSSDYWELVHFSNAAAPL
jgi:hypothetical protein